MQQGEWTCSSYEFGPWGEKGTKERGGVNEEWNKMIKEGEMNNKKRDKRRVRRMMNEQNRREKVRVR